ncbi:MAG: cyclic pyranopterin monophosphate synthase MoaC [Deltaproteobacteria bacterium]|nr:cyclic pyranopterin monophosphate synthase MoaC [Deltaproteobacteria bacterium]
MTKDNTNDLTHFSDSGRARMVDVSEKATTERVAVARGTILMNKDTLKRIRSNEIKKGDVLTVANISAVMATKRTSDMIPMCHPLPLTGVEVDFEDGTESDGRASIEVTVTAKCVGQTGVEMEALSGASTALLTIYDMCKAIDRGMTITNIELIEKRGGKSGHWLRSKEV